MNDRIKNISSRSTNFDCFSCAYVISSGLAVGQKWFRVRRIIQEIEKLNYLNVISSIWYCITNLFLGYINNLGSLARGQNKKIQSACSNQ